MARLPTVHQQWNAPRQQFQVRGRSDLPGIEVSIEHLGDDQVQIRNSGAPVRLTWHDAEIPTDDSRVEKLPVQIVSGDSILEVHNADRGNPNLFLTIERGRTKDGSPAVPADLLDKSPPASTTLASWFESIVRLQQEASGSNQLLKAAVEAIIQPGGLDCGMLLMKTKRGWTIEASAIQDTQQGIAFDSSFVSLAAEDFRTLYHDSQQSQEQLHLHDSTIASPIFDAADNVVGILYASRSVRSGKSRRGIRPLEALWTQLVAESITSGLIRENVEADAARTRVMLEQTFSSDVAKELMDNPAVLDGCEREVTVLFVDLRGFASLSEDLGPRNTYKLLSDLLEQLTECVMEEGGVIIDYYGDGLAAMWNAPKRQPDHAMRACRAAKAMENGLGTVSDKWMKRSGEQLRIGVGINTGITQVGNAGSRRRLKYGPRGSAVNIASRLETATKRVKAGILITDATRRQLPQEVMTRRVCRAALSGIREPVDLYELVSLGNAVEESAIDRIDRYESILSLYEEGNIETALEMLEERSDEPQHDYCYSLLKEQIHTYLEKDEASRAVFDLTTSK
ncbi:MAG: adenylate/guanylate cyclase domain-containing protein [Planctomycetota bacterium]